MLSSMDSLSKLLDALKTRIYQPGNLCVIESLSHQMQYARHDRLQFIPVQAANWKRYFLESFLHLKKKRYQSIERYETIKDG